LWRTLAENGEAKYENLFLRALSVNEQTPTVTWKNILVVPTPGLCFPQHETTGLSGLGIRPLGMN